MTKKRKIKLLTLLGFSIIPSFSLVAAACGSSTNTESGNPVKEQKEKEKEADSKEKTEKQQDDKTTTKILDDKEFESFVNTLKENNNFSITQANSSGMAKTKKNTLPSEVLDNKLQWKVTLNDNVKSKVSAKLVNITTANSETLAEANRSGNLTFFVEFTNPVTKHTTTKSFIVDGWETNQQGTDRNGRILRDPSEGLKPKESDLKQYLFSLNQKQRFDLDDAKYLNILKQQVHNADWKGLRPDLSTTTADQIKTFNEKAKTVGVSSYESSAYKGFTLPKYKSDGSVDGVIIYGSEMVKGPSWVDTLGKSNPYKARGLARTLPNQHYVDIAKQTYSVVFHNWLISEKEEVRKALKPLLVSPEQVSDLIPKLKNKERQDYFRKRLGTTPDANWQYQLREEIMEEIYKEYSRDEGDKIFDEYIKKFQDIVIERVNSSTNAEIQKIKNKVISKIKDEINFFKLENLADLQTSTSGTMWIMDYEIPEDSTYPTKWYFGTNVHVADAIYNGVLNNFSLTRLNGNTNPVGNKLKLTNLDDRFQGFAFNPETVRKAYDGKGYLNKKPSDYLASPQKEQYKDVEAFLDFAVIEIDFSKITGVGMSAQDYARSVTNNYANLKEKQVKFLKNSYLKDYSKIDFPLASKPGQKADLSNLDQLYILGFPWAESKTFADYYLEKYIDDDQKSVAKYTSTLWINSDSDFYNTKNLEDEKLKRGNFLSYELGYRSFSNKPGVTDVFLAAPNTSFGNKNPLDNLYTSKEDNKKYMNFGLEYMPRWYAPGGGASGSSVRNQRNELVGVYHFGNGTARTGLAVAFRSEGYDYQGLYGSYNLPQYDLIYGGGKDQKTSYRETLAKLDNGPKKTALFPNGFDDSNVPAEFKFPAEAKAGDK